MGPWFDDVVVGAEHASAGRTVTEADVVGFAGLSGDFCECRVALKSGTSRVGQRLLPLIVTFRRQLVGVFPCFAV